ncbi:hypothetical protein Tco_0085075 [Tanacetum coccineum]
MANSSRMVLRTLMLTEPWLLLPPNTRTSISLISSNPFCGCRIRTRRISYRVNCNNESENIVAADGDGDGDSDVEPPQEAVLKLISEVSKTEGRVGQTTNMVLGGTVTDDATDEWLTLDQKFQLLFIGAFISEESEVSKTEGRVGQTTNMVLGGTVTDDATDEWLTLDQKVNTYPTVRGFTAIGTGGDDFVQAMVVAVESVLQHQIPQVQAVYNTMKSDERMKYFL